VEGYKKRLYLFSNCGKRLAILILVLFSLWMNISLADSVKIKGIKKTEVGATRRGVSAKAFFRSDVSLSNLLGLDRKTPYSLPSLPKPLTEPKTLKILAIRVQFKKEIPDDPTTTGNGQFDMRSYQEFYEDEGNIIDPAPHNRAYFEGHLKALDNYWNIVSKEMLRLELDVYPKGDSVYTLPYTISHYGSVDSAPDPNRYPIDQLDSLFRHSFILADTSNLDEIDFSGYDVFVLFHAGSDKQHDLGEQGIAPSPSDLFSGFIRLGKPVIVGESVRTDSIWEGLIIPETCSQDGRITALDALLAHEFGHQLGLVDLYNTETFTTQVGDFSLMDNNGEDVGVELDSCFSSVSGIVPVYPDAWSKAFLGFICPEEIRDQKNVGLLASELLGNSIQTIKVPINSEEYFLIENRQTDLDNLPIPELKRDSLSGVILGFSDVTFNNKREYDYLLPGSGILIWHIDEGVAYLDYDGDGTSNFFDNKLQWNKNRRFISLVEADGIIDFGGDYYTGFGLQEDMFYRGNNSSFTPYTYPNTQSNDKSFSHIWVTNIGYRDTLMNLDVKNDWDQEGFPQKIIPQTNISSLVFADVDGDGVAEVFASSGNFIYAWKKEKSFFPNSDLVRIIGLNGDTTYLPLAIFGVVDSTILGPPSIADLDGDDTLEIVVGTLSGKIYAFKPYDRNTDNKADLMNGFPIDLKSSVSMTSVVSDFDPLNLGLEIFAGTEDGYLFLISSSGEKIWMDSLGKKIVGLATTDSNEVVFVVTEDSLSGHLWRLNWKTEALSQRNLPCGDNSYPVVGDLDRDDSLDVIVIGGDGKVYAWDKGLNLLSGFPINSGQNKLSAPALGDIDGDGYLEIVTGGKNKIFAYNFNGTTVDNFPIKLDNSETSDLISSSPVLADVDGDGTLDIILGTKERKVFAFNKYGEKISGFPLSTGGGVGSSSVFLNLDEDENSELLVASADGFVYAWELPFSYKKDNDFWSMEGFSSSHTNHFPSYLLPEIPAFEFIPERLAYVYPNPARDQAFIRYFLGKDAEVRFKIYDLAGDLVDDFSQEGMANTENEKEWNCSKFSSGVYLCRMEAKAKDENKVLFIKIAVVK
jgi:M6 family metalloprotease-like protein